MVRIRHLFQVARAAVKYPFSTLQEKDGDLFALANRNHSSKSARALACLLRRDVAFDYQQKI
jgi:hypothetical protein